MITKINDVSRYKYYFDPVSIVLSFSILIKKIINNIHPHFSVVLDSFKKKNTCLFTYTRILGIIFQVNN